MQRAYACGKRLGQNLRLLVYRPSCLDSISLFQSGLKLEDSSFNSNEELRLESGPSAFYQAWTFLVFSFKARAVLGFEKIDS